MLLEKAHYIKYKSQVIIVRFDEETGEFRVRRESKVVAGPKRVCVPSVRVKRIFNQSAMSRRREAASQPAPHTTTPIPVSPFNRKVAFGSRLYS